ncbi:hypothetical protein ACHAWF_001070 [Thalassiosira exigua]
MTLPTYAPRPSPAAERASRARRTALLAVAIGGLTVLLSLLVLAGRSRGPPPPHSPSASASASASGSDRQRGPLSGTLGGGRFPPVPALALDEAAAPNTIRLRSGLGMPAIGYGTCCRPSAKGEAVYSSTLAYLKLGGRLVDTAMAYRNHVDIGRAAKDSGIPRPKLWITSKVAPGKVKTYGECLKAVDEILDELDTEYLDLLLIHTPKLGKELTIELWRCLIEAKRLGKSRAIGVSNFNRGEIQDLVEGTGEMPEANEIQYHPWSAPKWKDLAKWHRENEVATIAYTSLGGSRFHKEGGASRWPPPAKILASRHSATEAQILLKWALGRGAAVIPGSGSKAHINENLLLPKFELTEAELTSIEKAEAPEAWWDTKRGPMKYVNEEADLPWVKRKNG